MDPDLQPWWTYRAATDPHSSHRLGVVDGDTLDLLVDQGMNTHHRERIRLLDVDTAEVYGTAEGSAEHEAGDDQSDFVSDWLQEAHQQLPDSGWPLVVRTVKDESGKYGRLLALVTRRCDGASLTADLRTKYPSTAD